MSRQNVELLRAALAAYNEHGVEALVDFVAPDFVATIPPSLSVEPDTYHGSEGLRRYFESWSEVMEEVRFAPEEFIEVGDKVVVPSNVVVKSRETGLELGQHNVQVWTLRDGRAVSVEAYPTKAEALRAAGLQDEPAR